MSDQFHTSLSTHDEESITVRDRTLSTEIMGEMEFSGAVYLLMRGQEPTDGEQRVVSAILSSLMVHGVTPHAIAARLTYLSEPTSLQGAVASGLAGVGSRFAGAMEGCSRDLQSVVGTENRTEAIEDLISAYQSRGEPFAGIGHPHFDPIDPRAKTLFALADEEDITGEHTDALHEIQAAFEQETGYDLPINVTGAIAAVTADMGFSPEAARGFAVISRATGLVAEVLDEQASPMATNIWQHVDNNATYLGDLER